MTRKWIDLAERVLSTFLQAFAAEWLVTSSFDELSFKIAAGAGVISAIKCLAGFRIGNGDSASVAPSV